MAANQSKITVPNGNQMDDVPGAIKVMNSPTEFAPNSLKMDPLTLDVPDGIGIDKFAWNAQRDGSPEMADASPSMTSALNGDQTDSALVATKATDSLTECARNYLKTDPLTSDVPNGTGTGKSAWNARRDGL